MSTATLDAALGTAGRVLVDSSAIIAFHIATDHTHSLAKHLFGRIEDSIDPLTGWYSVVSAAEVLVRPIRSGAAAHAHMLSFLTSFPNLQPVAMDFDVAHQAATIRATTGLKTADAIIIASGVLAGCEAIVTGDEEWAKRLEPSFTRLRWVYLPEHV